MLIVLKRSCSLNEVGYDRDESAEGETVLSIATLMDIQL